jgi:uncharacterized protein YcbX
MKKPVGVIQSLHRYPVKSMQGEALEQAGIAQAGVIGDRLWIVRLEERGENALVRTFPKLLNFSAKFLSEPSTSRIPEVEITLPDGAKLTSKDKQINKQLSKTLGKPVTLWPLQPASHWRHYLQGSLSGAQDMRRKFGSTKLPSLSSLSWPLLAQLSVLTTPLGRYQDCYPLHLITTSSLDELKKLEPQGDFCAERFRPNLVIESLKSNAFDDTHWLGGKLYIGDQVVLKVESKTVRCSMPAQPQVGLVKDPLVIKTLDAHTDRYFGVNLTVISGGQIQVGDTVEWAPEQISPLISQLKQRSDQLKDALSQRLLEAMDRVLKR